MFDLRNSDFPNRPLWAIVSVILILSLLGGCKFSGRRVRGPAVVLPADPAGGAPDLLAVNWQPTEEDEVFYLTYLAPAGKGWRPRWEIRRPQVDGWYEPRVVYDEGTVYAITGDRLLALGREDGEIAWEISLTDLTSTSCTHCLQLMGNRLVVLTADYTLHGIDPGSGEIAWQVRLNDSSTAHRGFWQLDGQVVLVDRDAEDNRPALYAYRPDDGSLIRRLPPTCPDGYQSPRFDADEVFFRQDVAGNGQAILLVECGEPAVQEWDLRTGELAWSALLPEGVRGEPDSVLFGRRSLYLVEDGNLVTIALNDGAGRLLAQPIDPDHKISLLAEEGEGLIAWAERTRGTARYELWGLSPAGKPAWRYAAQVEDLLNVDQHWAEGVMVAGPDGLYLIQVLEGEPDKMLVELIDPQMGTVAQQSSVKLEYAGLDAAVWHGNRGYLTASGRLWVLDLTSGEVTKGWP